jgi:hypothetical protein
MNNFENIDKKTIQDIENQIKYIFVDNKLNDLKHFFKKRQCLNTTNQIMNYLFHIIQSAGVLTTTIAAGYQIKQLIWIGVGLNILASLINIFERTNNAISKKLLKDIYAIKNGTYVDEGIIIDVDEKNDNSSPLQKPLLEIKQDVFTLQSHLYDLSQNDI